MEREISLGTLRAWCTKIDANYRRRFAELVRKVGQPQLRRPFELFLTLRKDADPDIPILKQAKAEYEKLK